VRAFLDTACGGAKISARIAVVTTHVAIAPDLSHACTLHRRACRPLLLASKRSEVGCPRRGSNPAQQNLGEKPIQGAPRPAAASLWRGPALCPVIPLGAGRDVGFAKSGFRPTTRSIPFNYCPNTVPDPDLLTSGFWLLAPSCIPPHFPPFASSDLRHSVRRPI
jgi:hypothetical protein